MTARRELSPARRSAARRRVATARTFAVGVAAAVAWPTAARAANDDRRLGAEFVDTPPSAAPQANGASAAPSRGDASEPAGYVPGYRDTPGLGLPPEVPDRGSALPSSLTPPFGAPNPSKGWRVSFSGYLQSGIRAGIGRGQPGAPHEGELTLHGDPLVPGVNWGWFEHTNTVLGPWAQLNFSVGDERVRATAILAAWNVGENDLASGYVQLPSKLWINDAFLTYTPDVGPVRLKVVAGVYPERYGAMAKDTTGAYAVSLIGLVRGVGATSTVVLPFEGDFDLNLEAGLKGNLDFAPRGITPDGSNEYARPWEGATYAAHAHAGFTYAGVQPTFHVIETWAQDDRADHVDDPQTPAREDRRSSDGHVTIVGADVRVDAGRYGYLYLGGSRVTARAANTVANVVSVMNSYGGRGLTEQYFGFASNGNGALSLLGAQYTVSVGTLLRRPDEISDQEPDLSVSVFGIGGVVGSDAPAVDGRRMLKYGAEVVYSALPWLAVAGRVDHAMPDLDHMERSFAVLSPKLVFRTDWATHAALTLQYARYLLGSGAVVNGDSRLQYAPWAYPDKHLLSLFGTIWW